jgi:hypothetical protein
LAAEIAQRYHPVEKIGPEQSVMLGFLTAAQLGLFILVVA